MRRRNMIKAKEEIDRLSDLPDEVLHHILSFIDTRSSVQSSILSRRWRSLWKYVPVLNFCRDSFRTELDFEQYVDQVLSLRSDCNLRKIATEFCVVEYRMDHLFHRVMEYAASHGLQHLNLCRSIVELETITSVSGCYQSLKVLKLRDTYLAEEVVGSLSRLQQLETLNLSICFFEGLSSPVPEDEAFPKLENLELTYCCPVTSGLRSDSVLRIYGARLLRLEIHDISFGSVEIVTPKLQYLCFDQCDVIPDVSKSKLPSLVRADVSLYCRSPLFLDISGGGGDGDVSKQLLLKRYTSLFNVLYNVQSLNLYSQICCKTCDLVKHQPSPFKRMKSLSFKCYEGCHEVPDEVDRYFLGGSGNELVTI